MLYRVDNRLKTIELEKQQTVKNIIPTYNNILNCCYYIYNCIITMMMTFIIISMHRMYQDLNDPRTSHDNSNFGKSM